MKAIIAVLVVIMLAGVKTKPFFVPSETTDEVRDYIVALFEGLDLVSALHPSDDCISDSDKALTYAAAGIDNFQQQNFWEGTLNISDSLGALSPLARQCDEPITEFAAMIENYPKQFKSFPDFLVKFSLNTLGNIKPLLDKYFFVIHMFSEHGNTTAAVQTIGEIIKLQTTINPIIDNPLRTDVKVDPLEYTWEDPLQPDPVSPLIWNIFESTFNLLVNSKLISPENLVQCEEGTLNMLLYNLDASKNFQASKSKAGVLSVLDSFQYLHQAIEGCTYTGIEIGQRSALIDKEVFGNPSVIWKNIVSNLFELFSDGLFGYAEYYYYDIISFFSAVGDAFYRTITYRIDKP